MGITNECDIQKEKEQIKNKSINDIPNDIVESIKNFIKTDHHNFFKVKSEINLGNQIDNSNMVISKLINIKNLATVKKKELENNYINIKKSNTEFINTLKKKLNL